MGKASAESKSVIMIAGGKPIRAMLKKALSGDYTVMETAAGAQALENLKKTPQIAAILLELRVPDAGAETLELLQKDEALCRIPVIAVTANEDVKAQNRAIAMGCADVLIWPFAPKAALRRVHNIIALLKAARLAEQVKWQTELAQSAEISPKTGLMNRQAFCREARRIMTQNPSPKQGYVIARWDIDRFKVYNDTYGTDAGDYLLSRTGECFKTSSLRPGASGMLTYGHWDADHFVSLWYAEQLDPDALRNYTLEQLNQAFPDYNFSISFGFYKVEDISLDVGVMCDRALLALRSTKDDYAKHYAWYDESMRAGVIEEQQLASVMKGALAQGQFVPYYQPQYDYSSGRIVGAEALVRWIHPQKGVIPPNSFIPIFEKNGFVFELDCNIWEQACAQLRAWQDAGLMLPSISVNVSRRDLYHPKLAEVFRELATKYGLQPNMLRLEITETAYMENPEQLIDVVAQLQQLGFNVEMDDFGSGYSSLNTLKDVPVDLLKLDMKFVDDDTKSTRGGSILCSVVRMAHAIDLPVLAEGVETPQQAEFLQSIGCLLMQGYLFSKPLSSEDFAALLKRSDVQQAHRSRFGGGVDGAEDFLNAATQSTLLFNSFLGGAAIVEYSGGSVAALRLNDRFFRELGTTRKEYADMQYRILDRFLPDSRQTFTDMLDRVISGGDEAECEVCSHPFTAGAEPIWTHCRARCLAQKQSGYVLYVSIENISDIKRLEARLEAERMEMENIVNSIPGGVAAYEVRPGHLHLLYASDGVSALLGRTPEEYRRLLNSGEELGVYPPDLPLVQGAITAAKNSGIDVDVNYRAPNKDRQFIWLNMRGRIMGTHNGFPVLHAVFHNLSRTTELYSRVLDESDNVLLVADRNTLELLYANEAAVRLSGLPASQVQGKRCDEYLPQLNAPELDGVAARLGSEPITVEFNFNGRHYFARFTHIDWNGRDAFITYLNDRTKSWSTQQQLEDVIRHIPGGLTEFRLENGRILRTYISEGALTALGYGENELPDTDLTESRFSRVHPDDRPRLEAAIREALEQRSTLSFDMRIVQRSGAIHWVNLTANPVMMPDGEYRYYGVYSDITKQREAQKATAFERSSLFKALSIVYPMTIAVNLSQNSYYMLEYKNFINRTAAEKGVFDDLIAAGVTTVPQEDKQRFADAFSRQNLLDAFASGKDMVRLEHRQVGDDGVMHWMETIVFKIDDPYDSDTLEFTISRTIDEQKAAEEKLREALSITSGKLAQRLHYGSLINNVTPGLVLLFYSGNTVPVFVVGNLPGAFGYTQEEMQDILGGAMHKLIFRDDLQSVRNAMQQAHKKRPYSFEMEFRVHKKNGELAWINARISHFTDEDGSIGYSCICLDNTEHHNMVEQLSKNEQIMRLVARHSDRVVCYYDIKTRKASSWGQGNCAVCGMPGLCGTRPQDAAYGSTVLNESKDELEAMFAAINSGGGDGEAKIHVQDADGKRRWFSIKYSPIFDENGNPTAAVLSHLDITSQYERELAYARYRQSLNDNNNLDVLFFETDLTADLVEKQGGRLRPSGLNAEGRSHTEAIAHIIKRFFSDDARAQAEAYFSREHLLSMYAEGRQEASGDWQVYSPETGLQLWMNIAMQFVSDPYNGHVKVFTLLKDVTQAKNEQFSMRRQAERDGMTGLYNRTTAQTIICSLLAKESTGGGLLLVLDLDDLKSINDTLGHAEGDKALCGVASELTRHFRGTDIIGRLGGDEFVVFLPGVSNLASLRGSLTTLNRKLSTLTVDEGRRTLHCSIGAALDETGSADFDTLYKQADIALYHVKRNGKNGFAFFTPDMLQADYQYQAQESLSLLQNSRMFEPRELQRLVGAIASFYPLVISANLTRNSLYLMEHRHYLNTSLPTSGTVDEFTAATAETLHPEDRESFLAATSRQALLARYAAGQSSLFFDCRQKDDDGKYRRVRVIIMFYLDDSGDVCEFSLMREIPEQPQA